MEMTLTELVNRLREVGPYDQPPSPTTSKEDTQPPLPGDETSEGEDTDEDGNLVAKGSDSIEEEDPCRDGDGGEPMGAEDPEEDPNEEEGDPIKEKTFKEDPNENEKEPMEEDDSNEGEVKFIEKGDLMKEPAGNKDNGVVESLV